jgi:hypothetical protein
MSRVIWLRLFILAVVGLGVGFAWIVVCYQAAEQQGCRWASEALLGLTVALIYSPVLTVGYLARRVRNTPLRFVLGICSLYLGLYFVGMPLLYSLSYCLEGVRLRDTWALRAMQGWVLAAASLALAAVSTVMLATSKR